MIALVGVACSLVAAVGSFVWAVGAVLVAALEEGDDA